MRPRKLFFLILGALVISALAAGCTMEGPCEVTGNQSLTIYRLPDPASDVFGTLPAGETHEVLAYTASGFVGFDPGVAQAGNTGLARHRWILLNASLSPFCLANVDLVTLPEVLADMPAASLVPPPPPPPPDPPAGAANMVITNVNLSSPSYLEIDIFHPLVVTVQNQGDAPADGYDLVFFPHYGDGPQNSSGPRPVPDLAPGESFIETFIPELIYGHLGNHTLRVLLTDDWLTPTGSTESTGTAGDFEDIEIHVILGQCNPFLDSNIPVILLNLQPDTRVLPFYLKVEGGVTGDPSAYRASLGEWEAYQCGLQGFEDRLYCLVTIPEGMEGTSKQLKVWVEGCPELALVQDNILIPIPKLVCSADLNQENCKLAGGTYKESRAASDGECICP